MFLQTLVQLNILILATPALAGWTLMPPANTAAVRAACIVWQFRTVEAATPKTEQAEMVNRQQTARPQPPVLPRFVSPGIMPSVDQMPGFSAVPVTILLSFNPFPHATRAP